MLFKFSVKIIKWFWFEKIKKNLKKFKFSKILKKVSKKIPRILENFFQKKEEEKNFFNKTLISRKFPYISRNIFSKLK